MKKKIDARSPAFCKKRTIRLKTYFRDREKGEGKVEIWETSFHIMALHWRNATIGSRAEKIDQCWDHATLYSAVVNSALPFFHAKISIGSVFNLKVCEAIMHRNDLETFWLIKRHPATSEHSTDEA